jgi:hypothetical protein
LIIRGTTPTHTFTLPTDSSLCTKVRAIYSQDDKLVFKIEDNRFIRSDNVVSCKLTQEETLMLSCKQYCDIQLRVLTSGGDAMACDIMKITVGRCLDDEVLE